jgi:hypothetical protein
MTDQTTLKELALGHFMGAKAADERDRLLSREAELCSALEPFAVITAYTGVDYGRYLCSLCQSEVTGRRTDLVHTSDCALHSTGERHARVIAVFNAAMALRRKNVVVAIACTHEWRDFCEACDAALKEPTDE